MKCTCCIILGLLFREALLASGPNPFNRALSLADEDEGSAVVAHALALETPDSMTDRAATAY
jgi:hypothetical protein